MNSTYQHAEHGFGPVYDKHSEWLILGSFPSVKSREQNFYYGHPQNRFWRVLEAVTGDFIPTDIDGKKQWLWQHRIALWDVVEACDIIGSSDAKIRNVTCTNLAMILDFAPIREIIVNGKTAACLYQKHQYPLTGRNIVILPSTSPANASMRLPELIKAWQPAFITEKK